MKQKNKFFLLFLTFFLLIVTPVAAQQVSLSISPPLLETVIKPGKSLLIAYSIENFADPAVYRSRVASFVPQDERGNILIKETLEGPVRFSLDNANLQLGDPFLLRARERQQLLLRIRIPEGAPEGDYYYTLLVESDPSPFQEGASAPRAQAGIGANILITISNSGRVDIKGKIPILDTLARFKFRLFGQNYRIFDSGDKVPVVMIIENSGKNMIKPEGEIVMKGPFGGKATFEILPQNILAQSQRQALATPSAEVNCDPQNIGNRVPFYCQRPSTVVLDGFFLGQYKISSSLNFGEGSQNVFAETSFIGLPLKFGLGMMGVIIVITFIFKKLKKNETEE